MTGEKVVNTQTKMKNLNEILVVAKETADRRTKVFNELIHLTEDVLLPKFREVLKNFNLRSAFFDFSFPATADLIESTDHYGENSTFGLEIFADGKYNTYELGLDGSMSKWVAEQKNEIELKLRKAYITEFAEAILGRIENLIEKYNRKVINAEKLIERINQLN